MSTVSEWLEVFLKQRCDLSDGTRGLYRIVLGRLPDIGVESFSPLAAQSVAANLADSGIAPATVNIHLRCIRAFFNWLVEVEAVAKSPFAKVRSLPDSGKAKVPYEDTEIGAMLKCCPNLRWRLIVLLAATAGLRRGEILNLTVSELDYHGGLIRLQKKDDSHATWAWDIKDRQQRVVPMTAEAEKTALLVQASLPEGQPYLCLSPQRYQRLQRRRRREALDYETRKCPENNFLRVFRTMCRNASVPYRTFHALRGSCLSIMAESGLQPHEVQAIAGHSSVRTTYQHYVRPRQQFIEKARNAAFDGRYWT